MRSALFSTIACLAMACADPVIEMRLGLPDPSTVSGFDLSCALAVRARVIGNDLGDGRGAEVTEDCVDLATSPRTFSDLAAALRGRFVFDVPRSGLAGVQLSAFFGRCSELPGTSESIVYGGAPSSSGGTLEVPLLPGVSCDATQSYKVRTFDLSALYATLPAGGTCAPPADSIRVFAGLIRPRMLGDRAPRTEFDYGHASVDTSDGTGRLQSYRPITNTPACAAIGYRGSATIGMTCIRPAAQARGVCGAADEVEVIAVPITPVASSIDVSMSATYGLAVLGSVWEASGTRLPIAGATVEPTDRSRGNVVYVDIGVELGARPPRLRQMTPVPGATSTNASGGFILYLFGEAMDITVKAPNHVTQTVRVAAAPDTLPTVAIALARQ